MVHARLHICIFQDTGDNPRDKPQKKARGQNRNRPRPAKEDFTRKLCPSKVSLLNYRVM